MSETYRENILDCKGTDVKIKKRKEDILANKLISLTDAVSEYTYDGMLFSHGAGICIGADSLAFGREMVRQGRKHIHLLDHCCSQFLNLFCAAGAIDKLETSFSGLAVFGFAKGVKRAVEEGRFPIEDYSNLTFGLRLLAGAMNWPFCPTVSGFGTDIGNFSAFKPDEYPCKTKIPEVTDPFTGKSAYVVSPLKPDMSAIHVTMADKEGNAIMLGTEWCRYELARASKKVVLQADYIVDTDCMRQFPNMVRIPDFLVDAVVYCPLGAWPHCSTGVYDVDSDHMYYMNSCMGSDEGFMEYRKKYIDPCTSVENYLNVIGKDRIAEITNTATAHLVDPFRKWILSDSEIEDLVKQAKHHTSDVSVSGK